MHLKGPYANLGLCAQLQRLVGERAHDTPVSPVPSSPKRPRRKATQLTQAQKARLFEEARAGATVKQLAEEFAVHRVTIANHLDAEGIERRHSNIKLTEAMTEEASRLRLGGTTYAALGRKFEVHPDTIRRAIKRYGNTGADR